MEEDLEIYLDSIGRHDSYIVESVLKENSRETTQIVHLDESGVNGQLIRKLISRDSGLGIAYQRIWEEQRLGKSFLHIPKIIDYYDTDKDHVVVMEYVQGETLNDVIARTGPSISLAVDVFYKLCDAVSVLHTEFYPPLIHRDIKPSNIILSYDGLTLIDFGIARTYKNDVEADTSHFGTRSYAPPEQFGFGQTDEKSDIYTMGLILYYCLTGKTPDQKARKHLYKDPRVPEYLRNIILRATAFDPSQRYSSIVEMRNDISQAIMEVNNNIKNESPQYLSSPTPSPTFAPKPTGLHKVVDVIRNSSSLAAIRNFIVIAIWLLFIWSMIDIIINPSRSFADINITGRYVIGIGMVFFGFGMIAYLLLDKRFIYKRLPSFPQFALWKQILVCISACLIFTLSSSIVAVIFFSV